MSDEVERIRDDQQLHELVSSVRVLTVLMADAAPRAHALFGAAAATVCAAMASADSALHELAVAVDLARRADGTLLEEARGSRTTPGDADVGEG